MIYKKKVFFKNGLHVIISTKNKMYYRYRYSWDGRDHLLSLGVDPDVSFVEAYQRALDANHLINQGINPAEWRGKQRITGNTTMDFRQLHAINFPNVDKNDRTLNDMLAKWQAVKNQYRSKETC